jgi:hypothetical protein
VSATTTEATFVIDADGVLHEARTVYRTTIDARCGLKHLARMSVVGERAAMDPKLSALTRCAKCFTLDLWEKR